MAWIYNAFTLAENFHILHFATHHPMLDLASLLALLVATASAIPRLPVRQQGASFAGLADGSTDSPLYNFTLAAVNTTLSNTNSTGAPLVLGWGPSGTSEAASSWAISVSMVSLPYHPRIYLWGCPDIRCMAIKRVAIFHAFGRCTLPHPWPQRARPRCVRP